MSEGSKFERLCRWFLLNAPEYRDQIRKVWLWAEWPGAWAADAGIDLVAEDHHGGLWAIQAKASAPSGGPQRELARRQAIFHIAAL